MYRLSASRPNEVALAVENRLVVPSREATHALDEVAKANHWATRRSLSDLDRLANVSHGTAGEPQKLVYNSVSNHRASLRPVQRPICLASASHAPPWSRKSPPTTPSARVPPHACRQQKQLAMMEPPEPMRTWQKTNSASRVHQRLDHDDTTVTSVVDQFITLPSPVGFK